MITKLSELNENILANGIFNDIINKVPTLQENRNDINCELDENSVRVSFARELAAKAFIRSIQTRFGFDSRILFRTINEGTNREDVVEDITEDQGHYIVTLPESQATTVYNSLRPEGAAEKYHSIAENQVRFTEEEREEYRQAINPPSPRRHNRM